ncbi:hypothetical protein M2323_000934 [Rhodoblastus acidophilus]|uniref:hypothetical protein n=1 Tax=Rhodoblastus acidophilus TaxID=1074 RepID=UPI002224EDC7|nr:hypothetical protein [Rhodoblastus acidophilus]MCW2283164.1 hypothetical protein [Rhodoblastus acidophilus]MCW2332025.1 hypothetical protein [Rhodoblastus acidophilus]
MDLSDVETTRLKAVCSGVENAKSFMAELTDYHGDAVATEYLMTVEIARALLRSSYPDVALEFLANRVERHALIRNFQKPFTLGSKRFDVAVLGCGIPEFLVEVKIGAKKLGGELEKDLKKILSFVNCLKDEFAPRLLSACVFQVHAKARETGKAEKVWARARRYEKRIVNDLDAYAKKHPDFEFEFRPLQRDDEGFQPDERTEDVDGTPMLGQPAHAIRYHAILIRRRQVNGPTRRPWMRSGDFAPPVHPIDQQQ